MSDFNRHTYIERARLLLKQKRYRDAEQHAAAILQNNPEDADALQVIGHCRLDTGSYQEAIKIFERCLSIQPEDDYIHYLMAFAWYKIKVAEKAIHFLQSAISINPYASGYYGLFAYVMLDENRYDNALQKANEGLAVNAHDLTCLNARSHALFRLKNKEAAFDTIREALAVDPDDDFTHTNFGWHFMEAGKHKQAREHFRQALRINPNNDRARIGYKESLKANLAPYRWMLMFSLWLSAKSKAGRWAVIIVIWVSVKLLSGVSDAAGYSGVAYLLIGLYVLFVVFSWVGTSIANMMLLLGREGKYVLTKAEKLVAASVGVCLLFALVSALWGQMLPTAKDGSQFYIALVFATLTLPLSRFEHADRLKTKKYIWWYTIGLTTLGIITALAILTTGPGNIQLLLMYAYLIGILVYTWAYSAVKI